MISFLFQKLLISSSILKLHFHSGWEYLRRAVFAKPACSQPLFAGLLAFSRHLPHVVWQRCGASKSGCRLSRSAALAESGLRGSGVFMDWIGIGGICFGVWVRLPKAIEQSAIRLGVGDQRHTWKYGTYEKRIYKEYVSHKQEGHRTYVMSMFFLFNACILPTLTFGIPLI